MNSNEMFDAIDKATKLGLREYVSRPRPLPVCNVQDLLVSTFCRAMDQDELISALRTVEDAFWRARKEAELRRDCEMDKPSEVTPFSFYK